MVGIENDSLLWFVFQDDSGAEAWLAMASAGGEPWAFNGRTLKVSPRLQEKGFTPLHRDALARLGTRLDGTPLGRLMRLVKKDAVAPRPSAARASDAPRGEPPAPGPHCEDWAHPDQWREFCCFPAIEWCPGETFLGSVMFSGPECCSIRYGDMECQKGLFYFHDVAQTPWAFTKNPGGMDQAEAPPEYLALIDDQDLIHGTGVRKVEDILTLVQKDSTRRGLQFYNCCIPMMTGDDVRGPLARFQERTGRKVVFTDMSTANCHQESLSQHILRELPAARRTPSRGKEGRFNLAGFRRTRGRDELVGMLVDIGAELNAAILPEVSLESLAGYREAAAQALMPNAYYREIYEMLEAQGLRTLKDRAPYGREGSARWLRDLGLLLGSAAAARLEASLVEADKAIQPEWESLRRRAAALRAGFVVGPGDAARLADPASSGGIQVPALLAEMGFGIDLLVFREKGRPDDPGLAPLLDGLPDAARKKTRPAGDCGTPDPADAGRHRVVPFDGREELSRLFRAGGLSIVYSNVRGDRRLTRSGLAGFSLKDLEMGPAGALRSLRRLVERCELPFFRENARLLRGGR
jgi:hypothetical protein